MKWILILLLICVAQKHVTAEDSTTEKLQVSQADFTSKDSIKWRRWGGFQLKDKTFAAIETKERFAYSPNATLTINIRRLKNVECTAQLQMFDKAGNYLGYLDILSKEREKGEKRIAISKFSKEIIANTYDYSIKIWLSGKPGGYADFKTITYEYNQQVPDSSDVP